MLKKIIFPVLLSFAVAFQSCNQFEKTDTGLEYKIVDDSAGTNAKMGDLAIVHMEFQNEKDTFDTYKRGGQPISIHLMPSFKGSLEEGLTYASKGDSLIVKVSNDSLYTKLFKNDSLPKEIKPGTFTTFHIRVVDVYSKERIEKEQKERQLQQIQQGIAIAKQQKQLILDSSQAQLKIDEGVLSSYLKKNKIKAERTENGIYYAITQPGTGEKPEAGDSVSLHYTGKLLDGKEFDKSTPERPMDYVVGVGMVIPGFDEGVMQLSKGSKATIYIPSSLAYGDQGIKKTDTEYVIAPNKPLIFELEILEVKKTKLK